MKVKGNLKGKEMEAKSKQTGKKWKRNGSEIEAKWNNMQQDAE